MFSIFRLEMMIAIKGQPALNDYVEIISRYREEEMDEEVQKSKGRSGVSFD